MKESDNKNEKIIDELGRIQIPYEDRQKLNLAPKDKVEIYKSGKNIILKKVQVNIERENIHKLQVILDQEIEINIDIKKVNQYMDMSNVSVNHIIRSIDELGKVVIPIEIRKDLNIKEGDLFKICVKDNMIILIKKEKKYRNGRKYDSHHNRGYKQTCHK